MELCSKKNNRFKQEMKIQISNSRHVALKRRRKRKSLKYTNPTNIRKMFKYCTFLQYILPDTTRHLDLDFLDLPGLHGTAPCVV